MARKTPKLWQALTLAAVPLGLLVGLAHAINPNAAVTTTGQGLEVLIDAPPGPVLLDGSPVLVSAWATLGAAPPTPVNFVYVVDVSGSMENAGFNPFQDLTGDGVIDAADDCNGDGIQGSAMDAACFGLIALNESLGDPANVDVGLVAFGDGAKTADMSPAAGAQTFTTPPQVDAGGAAGVPDVEEVIRSVDTNHFPSVGSSAAGIGLFAFDITDGFAFQTDYDAALTAMNAAFATQAAGEVNIAFFLSDGEPTAFTMGLGSPLQAAADAGTKIHTFGIGAIAPGSCDPGEPLQIIADTTGGTCTEVADPSTLATVLPESATTNLISLELKVNGVVVASTVGVEPVSMHVENIDVSGALVPGVNLIEATALAADGTEVTASVELVAVLPVTIDIKPGSFPNSIKLSASGVIPVAILTDATFDATTVNPASVVFAGDATEAHGTGHIEDVDGDGDLDLVLHYETAETNIAPGDTEACLTGETFGGIPIQGCDSVRPL